MRTSDGERLQVAVSASHHERRLRGAIRGSATIDATI